MLNEKDIDTLIEIRKLFIFESFGERGIKEYVGAANFKIDDALNTIEKILIKNKVKLIGLEEFENEISNK